MWKAVFLFAILLEFSSCYKDNFLTKTYHIGIEYDHSLPMKGGSNKYRHRNNYDPFFVTISATAKKGYVLDFLVVTATVDAGGDVDFQLLQGDVGSQRMSFQLVSNGSDFLQYTYMAYGIKAEDYQKMANHITLPITNDSTEIHEQKYLFVSFFSTFLLIRNYVF